MTTNLLTVATATVGDSWEHLYRSMLELRRFTKLPFFQIVSDDGTASEEVKAHQREVVNGFRSAAWVETPGPTYGISYNLNHLFSLVETPWAFVIEDAVRPGLGWLETAVDAIDKIGSHRWGGRPVGGIGLVSSFDHWELEVAGALPGQHGMEAYFGRVSHDTARSFWADCWNDGLLCWPRLIGDVREACQRPTANQWPEIVQRTWRQPILDQSLHQGRREGIKRYWGETDWPKRRGAWPAQTPGAWGLYNMAAWRDAGKFRDGCPFYEGHLGVRLAQRGYLCVNIDNPPWLHYPSMAFNAVASAMGKEPRHIEKDHDVFMQDFGADGPDHLDLEYLVSQCYRPGVWEAAREELAAVQLYAAPEWDRWGKP